MKQENRSKITLHMRYLICREVRST